MSPHRKKNCGGGKPLKPDLGSCCQNVAEIVGVQLRSKIERVTSKNCARRLYHKCPAPLGGRSLRAHVPLYGKKLPRIDICAFRLLFGTPDLGRASCQGLSAGKLYKYITGFGCTDTMRDDNRLSHLWLAIGNSSVQGPLRSDSIGVVLNDHMCVVMCLICVRCFSPRCSEYV